MAPTLVGHGHSYDPQISLSLWLCVCMILSDLLKDYVQPGAVLKT